ncbi:MAG: histidine triad nucleotide-binding protein [Proteobacteria bacterium]|nr:histidine triad nucleotide-binding protein [Pseudomonadota bacterium]MBU1137490.1 histidine triad nucleotide-binding protein [Pseudomonadota bacterium]
METDCLFCKIAAGGIPVDVLYEDDELLAFRDIAPQAPIHFLIIPKKHIQNPAKITAEDEELMGRMLRRGAAIAQENGAKDFRLVFNSGIEAGQTVFHIHMHVLGGRSMQWPPG